MADSFKIGSVLPRLFNGSKYETTTNRPSNQVTTGTTYNPFATSGMKVDVLTADVFDTTSFTGGTTPSASKIKRMASALVGSIGDAFPTFRKGIENITAFCGRVKNEITSAWHFLQETRVPGITDLTNSIKSQWEAAHYAKEVKMYASMPVDTLRTELTNSLSIAA
ncbi:hypothetical protein IKP85_07480 [bacterium]|nr:hypothetical protein [bacterium]